MQDFRRSGSKGPLLPFVDAYTGVTNGLEAYVFGHDETGAFTGEWHIETITGVEDVAEVGKKIARINANPAVKADKHSVKKAAKRPENMKEHHHFQDSPPLGFPTV